VGSLEKATAVRPSTVTCSVAAQTLPGKVSFHAWRSVAILYPVMLLPRVFANVLAVAQVPVASMFWPALTPSARRATAFTASGVAGRRSIVSRMSSGARPAAAWLWPKDVSVLSYDSAHIPASSTASAVVVAPRTSNLRRFLRFSAARVDSVKADGGGPKLTDGTFLTRARKCEGAVALRDGRSWANA
jgi:hypothetical protein